MSTLSSTTTILVLLASASCLAEPPDALLPDTSVYGGAGETAPELSPVAFRPDVQADLDALGCTGATCHGGGALPMKLKGKPASDEQWSANYEQVQARAGSASSDSPLLAKAAGEGGHIKALPPDDPAVLRWTAWITSGTPYELGASGDGGSSGEGGGSGEGGAGAGSAGPTWNDDIGPLLAARGCLDCHAANNAQGAYSVASYAAAKGFGSDDVPNIVPGDAASLLVAYAAEGHGDLDAPDALAILGWVVDHDAAQK